MTQMSVNISLWWSIAQQDASRADKLYTAEDQIRDGGAVSAPCQPLRYHKEL